jgi:hypothetical protein
LIEPHIGCLGGALRDFDDAAVANDQLAWGKNLAARDDDRIRLDAAVMGMRGASYLGDPSVIVMDFKRNAACDAGRA